MDKRGNQKTLPVKTTAILGYPGAGKTWAVSEFIKYLQSMYGAEEHSRVGLVDYHRFYTEGIVIVGKYDGSKFQGTDRLSMAVAPHFEAFFAEMAKSGVSHIIAEGDRINCMPFLKTAMQYGQLERIKCVADPVTLRAQRERREHVFTAQFLNAVASKVDKHTFDHELTSQLLLDYLKTNQ